MDQKKNFWDNDEGGSMPEYALIAALIAAVVAITVGVLGLKVRDLFNSVNF
jgi:Flp pilus assembly pilin Flp